MRPWNPEPGIQEEDKLLSGIVVFPILTTKRTKPAFCTKTLPFHWQNPEENWPTESKPIPLTMANTRLSHSVWGQIFQSHLQFWTIIAGKMAVVGLGTKKSLHIVIFYVKRIVFTGILNVEKWQSASYRLSLFLFEKRLSGTFLCWVHFV